MKKFKKLIPAFCMLLVSAVMLGSSTFAWFSMNNKVTATGMEVTAKSNTQFLVISGSETSVVANYSATSVSAVMTARATGDGKLTDNYVYPVAYNNGATELTLYDAGKTGSGRTVSVPSKGWYTANSTDYNSVGSSTGTDNTTLTNISIVTNDLGNYVLEYKVWISTTTNSDPFTDKKLNVIATFSKDEGTVDAAVCALVTVGNTNSTEDYYFAKTDAKTGAITKNGTKNFTFNNTTPVAVVIKLFIDGTSENVKSSNTTTLTGKLSLAFEVVNA